jgi:hypothetical protein
MDQFGSTHSESSRYNPFISRSEKRSIHSQCSQFAITADLQSYKKTKSTSTMTFSAVRNLFCLAIAAASMLSVESSALGLLRTGSDRVPKTTSFRSLLQEDAQV